MFPDAIKSHRITGLILAGGSATRMGSVDKGLQSFRGEPLIAAVRRRLLPQVGSLVVSANRNRDRYAAFGDRVVTDVDDSRAGPLAGLQAGLQACRTEFLAVVPCDAPFVPHDLVARLASAFTGATLDASLAATVERTHPVFCLLRATLHDDLDAYLDGGGRAVGRWLRRQRMRAVSFDDEQSFRNINTFEELLDAERIAPPEAPGIPLPTKP